MRHPPRRRAPDRAQQTASRASSISSLLFHSSPHLTSRRAYLPPSLPPPLPPSQVLHFSLLRFVFDPETLSRKKSKYITRFPPSIDMRRYLSPQGRAAANKAGEGTIYDLRAVLVHKGNSAYSGHYCAEVYNTECAVGLVHVRSLFQPD